MLHQSDRRSQIRFIELAEWLDYYTYLSACIPDDDYFEVMVKTAFNKIKAN
jgi:hypothetical protein